MPNSEEDTPKTMKQTRRTFAAALLSAATAMAALSPAAGAAPQTPNDVAGGIAQSTISVSDGTINGSVPEWLEEVTSRAHVQLVNAYSPSMQRQVPLVLIKGGDQNLANPTLYLLNGADGGEAGANWIQQSDVLDFYADKNVNVVIPMAGQFSYYTDWVTEPAQLGGKQMWETFLTKELPGPIESWLGANNKRAIAGMSMSATSSLLLAEHNPDFYDAVGSFSGCAATASPHTDAMINVTLERVNSNSTEMWGPMGSDLRHWNDGLLNADKLRGKEIYVSNGSGLAGYWDMPSNPRLAKFDPAVAYAASVQTTVVGGLIEAGTNACTHDLRVKLDSEGIPADFNFRPTGTHTWGYWEEDLRDSWATFARAFYR